MPGVLRAVQRARVRAGAPPTTPTGLPAVPGGRADTPDRGVVGTPPTAQPRRQLEPADPCPNTHPSNGDVVPTIQQLVRKGREEKPPVTRLRRSRAAAAARVCTRVYTTTPKKPNSALARWLECADQPDRGHRLHPWRGPQPAGALDGPHPRRPSPGPAGRPYKIIRGPLDTQGVKSRKQARSRYGAKKEKS